MYIREKRKTRPSSFGPFVCARGTSKHDVRDLSLRNMLRANQTRAMYFIKKTPHREILIEGEFFSGLSRTSSFGRLQMQRENEENTPRRIFAVFNPISIEIIDNGNGDFVALGLIFQSSFMLLTFDNVFLSNFVEANV